MIRTTSITLLAAVLISVFSSPSLAQQDNRRRQFIQGLLKTFIDSQLPDERAPAGRSPQGRPTKTNRPAATALPGRQSPEMRRAGEQLSAASKEMSLLVEALQADVYRAQGVRELLNLAFKVNSDAAVLAQRLSYGQDNDSLRESLRELDQDWRTLEYRLGQTRNLSRDTLGHIKRIQDIEAQLAQVFEVPLQVNLDAVSTHAIQMSQAMRTLLQDIRYEVPDRDLADALRNGGRDTYEQLQRLIQITRPTPGLDVKYEDLKREFLQLERNWVAYQRRLRQSNNRYVQRQAQLINDDMRTMHELLYIARGQVNRDELKHSAMILRTDLDLLLRRINLKMLTSLPAASQQIVIKAASDLDGSCNDFADLLDDDFDNIRDMYLYMHDEWQQVDNALQNVTHQPVRQVVRDVERSLAELQSILGVRFDVDRKAATELAAQLSANARHMQTDIRDFFGRPNRYPRDFQNKSLRDAADFEASARRVYEGLSKGENLQTLKQRCLTMTTSWETLNQLLPRFSASERSHLTKIEREIMPQLVQMQTLLAL